MKNTDDEMREDYSEFLSAGVRGKYFERAMEAKGFILLDPEVQKAFPDAQAVNEALRTLLRLHTQAEVKSAA